MVEFLISKEFIVTTASIAIIVLFILFGITIYHLVDWIRYEMKTRFLKNRGFKEYIHDDKDVWAKFINKKEVIRVSDTRVVRMPIASFEQYVEKLDGGNK